MTVLEWFLSEAAVPVAFGAVSALVVDVARRAPVRVRHYRWRNKRFLRRQVRAIELRSRARRGGSEEEMGSIPRTLPVPAGDEARGPDLAAPSPAPSALVGAARPQLAAPTRPQRVRVTL